MDQQLRREGRRVLKSATLSFGWGGSISCIVRNISDHGAAVQVESTIGIPDFVILNIADDKLRQPSRVVWRKQTQLGLQFDHLLTTDASQSDSS